MVINRIWLGTLPQVDMLSELQFAGHMFPCIFFCKTTIWSMSSIATIIGATKDVPLKDAHKEDFLSFLNDLM